MSDPASVEISFENEFDAVFSKLSDHKPERLHRTPESISFWKKQPQGVLLGQDAINVLKQWFECVNSTIKASLSKHSAYYWLFVFRRMPVPQHYPSEFLPQSPETSTQSTPMTLRRIDSATVRNLYQIIDAAILRYARFETKEAGKQSVFRLDSDNLQRGNMRTTHFAFEEKAIDVSEVLYVESLAFEIWRCEAVRRGVSKGSQLVVLADWYRESRSVELDLLIKHDDKRNHGVVATLRGVPLFSRETMSPNIELLTPILNAEGRPVGATFNKRMSQIKARWRISEQTTTRFVWNERDIISFYGSHKCFEVAFSKKYKLRLSILLATIGAILEQAATQWRLHPQFTYRDWCCGYTVVPSVSEILKIVQQRISGWLKRLGDAETVSEDDLRRALDYLTVKAGEAKYPMDRRIHSSAIVEFDGGAFIDFSFFEAVLGYLCYDLEIENEEDKGRIFEDLLGHDSLVIPRTPLIASDGTEEQIDAAFDLGSILLIIDCKAVMFSHGTFIGDIGSQAKSNEKIDHWLFGRERKEGDNRKRGIDQKAQWLIQHPVLSQKYDIRRYAAILPIVVSTFAHFIPSTAPKYWILYPGQKGKRWNEHAVPRVLSMVEFFSLFASERLIDIAPRSPNLRRL